MMLADRLKKSVQEILQLSTLEHELWLGYMLFEDQENKKTMTKTKQQMPRAGR
jgi:hypothetical protein